MLLKGVVKVYEEAYSLFQKNKMHMFSLKKLSYSVVNLNGED